MRAEAADDVAEAQADPVEDDEDMTIYSLVAAPTPSDSNSRPTESPPKPVDIYLCQRLADINSLIAVNLYVPEHILFLYLVHFLQINERLLLVHAY